MINNQFDWVDFYKELASKLLRYKGNRNKLVEKVKKIYEITGINFPTLEKDNQLVDIDPFTFFGLFNKSSMKEANRINLISAVAELFSVAAPVPTSFNSIPVLNNQNATFYYFVGQREENDIDDLWNLFESALAYAASPTRDNCEKLSRYFDLTINKKGNGNSKITMGLYWIAPNSFLNLDQRNTWYIYESGKIPASVVDTLPAIEPKIRSSKYFDIIEKLRAYLQSNESFLKDFKELSFEAWKYSEEVNKEMRAQKIQAERESTTQTQYDTHTLHSNNMYQIFTYVKNKEAQLSKKPHEVSGMLLYAKTDELVQPNNTYQMSGNKISVLTLDLSCDFSQIASQLDQIASEHFGIIKNYN